MATKRRRKNKNTLSVLFFLLLIVAAGCICYLVWDNYFRDKSGDEPQPAEIQQADDTEIKDGKGGTEEEKKTEPEPEKKETPVQYDGDNPNTSAGITGVITYAGVSGSNLMIRVNIDQYLSGGTCKLTLKQNGNNIYTASAPVIDAASTSTCEGFNVPVSGLPKGAVDVIISVASGNKSGEIVGKANL